MKSYLKEHSHFTTYYTTDKKSLSLSHYRLLHMNSHKGGASWDSVFSITGCGLVQFCGGLVQVVAAVVSSRRNSYAMPMKSVFYISSAPFYVLYICSSPSWLVVPEPERWQCRHLIYAGNPKITIFHNFSSYESLQWHTHTHHSRPKMTAELF